VTTFGLFSQLDGSTKLKLEKLEASENIFELFRKIYDAYDKVFILESLVGPKELSEMSVIGFDPEFTVTCDSKTFKVLARKRTLLKEPVTDPLLRLRELLPKISDSRFRYVGGAVGYISYDAVRFWEHLPAGRRKGPGFPLLEFGIYLDGILYNHKQNQAYYFYLVKSRLEDLRRILARPVTRQSSFSHSKPRRNMTKTRFKDIVKKAKGYVYDGDVFQVVLAKSLEFTIEGSLMRLYESLRLVNPSPYMYLLKMSGRSIIGSSPEMLMRVTDDFVETFPIAGTRPVVNDSARNENGRVCKFGTVRVKELMTVKRFSHVQHIVSHVTGQLQEGRDSFDALRAVFPAGTVSGAPKVRAMEVIDELEPTLRGPYAGALGYFSFNGSCDFAITIRSLFVNKTKGYIQSGAGIVMDSDPSTEWTETEHKANAMLTALKNASR
jgi:anthranilate synthase component 1